MLPDHSQTKVTYLGCWNKVVHLASGLEHKSSVAGLIRWPLNISNMTTLLNCSHPLQDEAQMPRPDQAVMLEA